VKAINCPQCGAPAKIEETSAPVYTCPYCNRSFDTGAAPPPKDDEPIPSIVIVTPPTNSGGGSSFLSTGIGVTVLVIIIGTFVVALRGSGGAANLVPMLGWDGKSALECAGNEQLTISDVTTTLPGTAVIASGNCHLKFVNCSIKADTVFELTGNAEVRLEGGAYEGITAIDASGNSVVRIAGATVTGKRKHSGNGRVDGK